MKYLSTEKWLNFQKPSMNFIQMIFIHYMGGMDASMLLIIVGSQPQHTNHRQNDPGPKNLRVYDIRPIAKSPMTISPITKPR